MNAAVYNQDDPLDGVHARCACRSGVRLTGAEIEQALRLGGRPPCMTVREFAEFVRTSESVIYRMIARGELRGAINGRGKPMRIWTARGVREFFSPKNSPCQYCARARGIGNGS